MEALGGQGIGRERGHGGTDGPHPVLIAHITARRRTPCRRPLRSSLLPEQFRHCLHVGDRAWPARGHLIPVGRPITEYGH
jgi:hypothetical protein